MCTPCKICWYDKALVATGYARSEYTGIFVWDVPFGEGWVEVTVHKIHDSDSPLIRQLKQYKTIGRQKGPTYAHIYVITVLGFTYFHYCFT